MMSSTAASKVPPHRDRREPGRRVAEVRLAVPGDDHRVGIADRVVAHLVGEHDDLAVGADREQALHRVGRDHAAPGVEIESEHAAAGVHEHFLSRAVRVHAQDVAARDRRVELAVLCEHDVLGACLVAERDQRQAGELAVGGMRTGVAGRGRRLPGDRTDRHRPECEVGGEHRREHDERPDDAFDHGLVPPRCG
jgi:hypothetical protein